VIQFAASLAVPRAASRLAVEGFKFHLGRGKMAAANRLSRDLRLDPSA